MSAAFPFHRDARDIHSFAADGNPPAIVFGIGVFGDGAPNVDARDIGEGVDVFFALLGGDVELVLDGFGEAIISHAIGRHGEVI